MPSIKKPGLPNITGSFQGTRHSEGAGESQFSGAFYGGDFATSTSYSAISSGRSDDSKKIFDASKSNIIYGASTTVQPPAIQLIAQIKF